MKVVHLFDRYLNSTMNWVYNLLRFTPKLDPVIAAPVIYQNQFHTAAFQFIYSPLQYQRKMDEWSVHPLQNMIVKLDHRFWGIYRRHLLKHLKAEKPDLLHAHFGNVAWQYLPLARKLDLPLVVSFYGYDYELVPYEKPVFRERYQTLFREASAILVAGPHGVEVLKKMGCPKAKIHTLPLGIIPDDIPFEERSKPAGRLHLLQAATITEKKGHTYALEAFQRFHRHHPNSTLSLVGEVIDRELFQKLMQQIREARLEESVRYLPFVPYDSFHRFLHQFDAFLHPSCFAQNRDSEGSAPIVLLDAQASGLPVIASDHCDIAEEVVHGKTGWIAPEKEVEGLVKGLEYFYNLPEADFAAYSRRARMHVETRYDIRHSGPRLQQIYQQVLQSS